MSELRVNSVSEVGGDAVITSGVLDSGSLPTGSILQVVRATDATRRDTTSTSFVDASISVSITPTSASSIIYVWWLARVDVVSGTNPLANLQITDASNVALSGAQEASTGIVGTSQPRILGHISAVGYDAPGVVSSVTYKGRFSTSSPTLSLRNDGNTGQLMAIEVAA